MHPIARLDHHTMTEIHNYKHPPQIVHDVMTSTFLLLGERRDDLEVWNITGVGMTILRTFIYYVTKAGNGVISISFNDISRA